MFEIITSFALGAVFNVADKLAGDKITDILSQFIDAKKAPQLISQTENKLQEKYSGYTFYNDLTSYILERKTIACLVAMFYNIDKIGVVGKNEFSEKNIQSFSESFKQYSSFDLAIVRECFDIIYQEVFNATVAFNPHTDNGKMQTYMASMASDLGYQNKEQTGILKQILAAVSQQNSAIATPAIEEDDIQESSKSIKSFLKQIDKISEQDISEEEAISKYLELSNSAFTKLRGEPQSQVDKVICALQCRIAIRYCNLGRVKKAFECLSNIDPTAADESKLYHFANAVIIVNHHIELKFDEARVSLSKALKLDENYHRAFLALQFLNALQKKDSLEIILNGMDSHFESILNQNDDSNLIADYYIHRAFIYKEFNDFVNAESMFIKAKEYGYDNLVADYNIALVYYSKATQHLPKNERFFGVNVDVGNLIRIIGICKYWLIDTSNPISDFVKTRMVSLYSSACGILGTKHGFTSIDEYLQLPDLDYETKRMLIFELEGTIPDQYMNHLDADDKLYAETVNFYKTDNYEGLKKTFLAIDDGVLATMPLPTLYMVLQMCIIKRDTETYHFFRKYIKEDNKLPLICCLDAYAFEIEDQLDQAKEIVDQYKETSTDYHLLSNVLGFYVRNNYLDDAKQLFLIILSKFKNHEMFIDEKEDFFGRAIMFFTKTKSMVAKDFIEASKNDLLENENIWRVKAQFYDSISDLPHLLECLNWLYQHTREFNIGINMIICNFQLMNYNKALEDAHILLSTIPEGNISERTRIIWMISNINLFLDNEDESYEWAKKAHEMTKETPSDESHAAYLTRATRTGHIDEALPASIEYKKMHPVIIDEWMKEIKISSDSSEGTFINKLDEVLGRSHFDYMQCEKDFSICYKRNHLPNSIILQRNNSLAQFFIFAMQNTLFLSNGDAIVMNKKAKIISSDIFVDALTLIVLQQYGCLELLKKIPRIHICYVTMCKLQDYYLTSDFVYVRDILLWLSKADNIVWEQNGFSFETELSKYFSNEYLTCCRVATCVNIPLLTIEPNFEILCTEQKDDLFTGIQTVGLVSLCHSMMDKFANEAHQGLYQLLEYCSFINFNADTIIAQIKKNNNKVIKESLSRFFFCNTSCNMISFAEVYLKVIKHYIAFDINIAIDFVELLLYDADRIWRRCSYYRYCSEVLDDRTSKIKVEMTVQYLSFLLTQLNEYFEEIPACIKPIYEKTSMNLMKYYSKNFFNNIKSL